MNRQLSYGYFFAHNAAQKAKLELGYKEFFAVAIAIKSALGGSFEISKSNI